MPEGWSFDDILDDEVTAGEECVWLPAGAQHPGYPVQQSLLASQGDQTQHDLSLLGFSGYQEKHFSRN